MLQPATKALAQMLAGRTGVSGQLNHARNLLAHAERLINDRVHNRLIPAEREEFFEQLARLRLTLADADAEAEVQAAEEQVERRPPPPPVAQERLKEMALALTRPERDRLRRPGPAEEPAAAREDEGSGQTGVPADVATGTAGPAEEEQRPPLRPLADLPGRLVLSRAGGENARAAIAQPAAPRRTRTRALVPGRPSVAAGPAENAPPAAPEEAASEEPIGRDAESGNGATLAAPQPRAKVARRTRKNKDGLPEGWVIDEEGYVVPRHD